MKLKLDNIFNNYDLKLNIWYIQEIIFWNIPNLWFLGNEGKKIGEYLGDGVDSKLRLNQMWITLSNSKENRGWNMVALTFKLLTVN